MNTPAPAGYDATETRPRTGRLIRDGIYEGNHLASDDPEADQVPPQERELVLRVRVGVVVEAPDLTVFDREDRFDVAAPKLAVDVGTIALDLSDQPRQRTGVVGLHRMHTVAHRGA
jgi:hypothetical protein